MNRVIVVRLMAADRHSGHPIVADDDHYPLRIGRSIAAAPPAAVDLARMRAVAVGRQPEHARDVVQRRRCVAIQLLRTLRHGQQ
jgi:hypothetical protein